MSKIDDKSAENARRRLKVFALHIFGYFIVMIILLPLNIFVYNSLIWFIFPMVAWGSVLAIHAAFVLGLFGHSSSNQ